MSNLDIERLARSLGVTDEGMELLSEVRSSDPARRVRANGIIGNKAIRFPSVKMGCVIQAESKTIEYANVLIKEFDDDVIEYWDQPPKSISISYQGSTRKVTVKPTFDYFVISKGFVGYEECKPTAKMELLVADCPDRYTRNPDQGTYESPAITRALRGTGLGFRVITEKSFKPVFVDNIEFILGYLTANPGDDVSSQINKVVKLVRNHKVISLAELIDKSGCAEAVYFAIAKKKVFVDFLGAYITDAKKFLIFYDRETYEKKKIVKRDAPLANINTSSISEKIMASTESDLSEAVRKVDSLERLAKAELTRQEVANIFGVTTKTIGRWITKISHTIDRQQRIMALLSDKSKRGNRGLRVDCRIERIMDSEINSKFLCGKAFVAHQVYLTICNVCEGKGLPPPSKYTFYTRLNSLEDAEIARHRKGNKAAYQKEPYQYEGEEEISLKGSTRFLQYCHIDHTTLDIQTVDEYDDPVGKPWLTTLVDDFTGAILSFYLSYDSPSYIALMMVIRMLVKNHGVLPEGVVVDGGKEFKGVNFEVFAAQYKIKILSREGQPRSGNAGERFFGVVNSGMIHNLSGNTKFMKDPRNISRTHNPVHSALWDFDGLVIELGNFFETYNAKAAICGGRTAKQLIVLSREKHGERSYLYQSYDNDFIFSVLPYVKRRTASLTRGRPIRVEWHDYWHSAFRSLKVKKTKVEVKWDPMDAGYVLAKLDGVWVKCMISNRNVRLRNDSRYEQSETLRKSDKIHSAATKQSRMDLNRHLMELVDRELELERDKKAAVPAPIESDAIEDELSNSYWAIDIPEATEKN